MSAWKKIIGMAAPALATALGGPLAGAAVREIGGKLLGKADASRDEVETFLGAATPEQLVELKRIDAEFAQKMAEAGIELERIEAADRESARNRQVEMKDWTPNILAGVLVVGFFSVQGIVILRGVEGEAHELVMRTLGTLDALLVMVFAFFFGSSRGSKQKDEILGRKIDRR